LRTALKLQERRELVVRTAEDHRDHLRVHLFIMLLPLYAVDLNTAHTHCRVGSDDQGVQTFTMVPVGSATLVWSLPAVRRQRDSLKTATKLPTSADRSI